MDGDSAHSQLSSAEEQVTENARNDVNLSPFLPLESGTNEIARNDEDPPSAPWPRTTGGPQMDDAWVDSLMEEERDPRLAAHNVSTVAENGSLPGDLGTVDARHMSEHFCHGDAPVRQPLLADEEQAPDDALDSKDGSASTPDETEVASGPESPVASQEVQPADPPNDPRGERRGQGGSSSPMEGTIVETAGADETLAPGSDGGDANVPVTEESALNKFDEMVAEKAVEDESDGHDGHDAKRDCSSLIADQEINSSHPKEPIIEGTIGHEFRVHEGGARSLPIAGSACGSQGVGSSLKGTPMHELTGEHLIASIEDNSEDHGATLGSTSADESCDRELSVYVKSSTMKTVAHQDQSITVAPLSLEMIPGAQHNDKNTSESGRADATWSPKAKGPGKGLSDAVSPQLKSNATFRPVKPKYQVGTKICKYFVGHGEFTGTIVSFDGLHYKILYEDGDAEDMDEHDIEFYRLLSKAKGDRALPSKRKRGDAFSKESPDTSLESDAPESLKREESLPEEELHECSERGISPRVPEEIEIRTPQEHKQNEFASGYDKSTSPIATRLGFLRRRLSDAAEEDSTHAEAPAEGAAKANERDSGGPITEVTAQMYPIGTRLLKHFGGIGWFGGVITSYNNAFYRAKYLDGDEEDLSEAELEKVLHDESDPCARKPRVSLYLDRKQRLSLWAIHGLDKAGFAQMPGLLGHSSETTTKMLDFYLFLYERHSVWQRRGLGRRLPWSLNRALDEFHFCCLFRELDRGTAFFHHLILDVYDSWTGTGGDAVNYMSERAKNWLNGDQQNEKTQKEWVAIVLWSAYLYRQVNRLETFKDTCFPFPVGKLRKFLCQCESFRAAGNRSFFTGAHQTTNWGKYKKNIQAVAAADAQMLYETVAILVSKDTEGRVEALQRLPGIGPFLAWQIECDLQESRCFRNEPVYCELGPGARAGLDLLFRKKREGDQDLVHRLVYMQKMGYERLGLEMPSWNGKYVGPKEIEHGLCEYSKYKRMESQILRDQEPNFRKRMSRAHFDKDRACRTCKGDSETGFLCDTCLDFYCKACLESSPKKQDAGWICVRCRRFEKELLVFERQKEDGTIYYV